jgi:hypothetical protein
MKKNLKKLYESLIEADEVKSLQKKEIDPNKPVSQYTPDEIMQYMRSKNLNVTAGKSANVSDEYKKPMQPKPEKLDEMSVSGIAPVDGTSQGPLLKKHNNKFSFGEWSKLRKSKKIKK